MKEWMLDRVNKIEDLEQRKLLKQMVSSLFVQLVEYQENMAQRLEQRVFDEVVHVDDRYDIYVTLCARDHIDPIHEFLYPMIPSDVSEHRIHLNELFSQLHRQDEFILLTVFLHCDYLKIRRLMAEQRHFRAELITTEGRYPVRVRLRQNLRYLKEVEKLHSLFMANNLPWKTVHHPYIHKFFDVVLEQDVSLTLMGEILEVKLDLEEFDEYKHAGLVPLWNIERLTLKCLGFPMPAKDKVHFEHVLSVRKTGAEHGYLVDGENEIIRSIRRTEDELAIVTPQEKAGDWPVYKITRPSGEFAPQYPYEIVSNQRAQGFLSGFTARHASALRTPGEIYRLIGSYEAAADLELLAVNLLDPEAPPGETYDMNPFLLDHLRAKTEKKRLRLRFRRPPEEPLIVLDTMSFVVSEVQMYFPEYLCEGEWI